MQNIIKDKRIVTSNARVTPVTIALIGKGIRDGSSYLPIRNYAAAAAAKAPRKNYPAQINEIWKSFLKNWRYVKDPVGVETVTINPRAVYNLVIGNNGGAGGGYGVGDCDDSTVALGALFRSAGFDVRIATIAPPGYPGIGFTHVFPQVFLNGRWINADPVLVPHKTLGDIAPNSRMAVWDLNGNLIATRGVPARALKKAFKLQGGKNVSRRRLF